MDNVVGSSRLFRHQNTFRLAGNHSKAQLRSSVAQIQSCFFFFNDVEN